MPLWKNGSNFVKIILYILWGFKCLERKNVTPYRKGDTRVAGY